MQPSGRAVIIGFGRVGEMIGNLLKEHGQDFVAVENDIEIVARGRRHGFPVVFGDVVRPELQNKLALENARVLILTMNDPVFSATIIRRVRKTLPDLPIIARAKDPEHAGELYRAGATNAIPETLESSLQMSESALVEMGVAMGPVIASIHEKRDDIRKIIRESGELDFDPRLKSFALASKSPE